MSLPRAILDDTLRTSYGEFAYKVVEKLVDAGFEALWVGGGVRDMLAGIIPTDIDIATSAKPMEVAALFSKTDTTSADLGSVRVPLGKSVYEVTTFREDDEASDGRHPESVSFGTKEEDSARRDFTINAIYVDPISRELWDPYNGEADRKELLIRFIGEPAIRIRHDTLRILRAVRFRAQIAGQYHPETFKALHELGSLVGTLSGTRIFTEFEKMLLGPHPDRALEDLWELDILEHILPELSICKGIAQPSDYHHEGDVWEHTLACARAFRADDSIDVRIAAIFHDCGKAETFSLKERIRFDNHATVSAELAGKALDRLQLPKKRREKICWVIEHHMMMGSFADMNDERKSHWYHHPYFSDLLRIFYLDIAGTDPADYRLYEEILADYHSFLDSHPAPEKPLLTGDEVMELLGIRSGAKVGEMMRALHEAQVSHAVTSKAEARDFLLKTGLKQENPPKKP